jgi:hypothetical protein
VGPRDPLWVCLWFAGRAAGDRVPEADVRRMHNLLQPPDPRAHAWEANCVRIGMAGWNEGCTGVGVQALCELVREASARPGEDRGGGRGGGLQEEGDGDVDGGRDDSAAVILRDEVDEAALEAARHATRTSNRHTADLAIRKVRRGGGGGSDVGKRA